MKPSELAARRYIDAWFEPDRARRTVLIEQCFAADGRIAFAGNVIRGRAELAAEIERFLVDPRQLTARLTSPIDAAATTFRFRALFELPGGERHSELVDIAEVDEEGRIAALYTFVEPLADATSPAPVYDGPAGLAARAAQRYIDVWTERDPAARRAQLTACFAGRGRLVSPTRTFHGPEDIAAMIDALLDDPRGLSARRTSVIEAAGHAFRFASSAAFGDGPPVPGEDAGEIDGDGRILVLYVFGALPRV